MKLIKIDPEIRPLIGRRREIRSKETPLKQAEALQISELRLDSNEAFHTNREGYVAYGWMEPHCAGRDHNLIEGKGIIFEPGERHRINKGEGVMVSLSSIDYKGLETGWETEN